MPRVLAQASTLPASNVIEYRLEGDNKVIFRPSGTEPKVKAYLCQRQTREEAEQHRRAQRGCTEGAFIVQLFL